MPGGAATIPGGVEIITCWPLAVCHTVIGREPSFRKNAGGGPPPAARNSLNHSSVVFPFHRAGLGRRTRPATTMATTTTAPTASTTLPLPFMHPNLTNSPPPRNNESNFAILRSLALSWSSLRVFQDLCG